MKKKCSKCKVEKDVIEFYKRKESKNGYRSWCISCEKKHRNSHEKEYKKYSIIYRENNKEKIKFRLKKYRENNKEKISLWHKNNYQKNKVDISLKYKKKYEVNKEKFKTRVLLYSKTEKGKEARIKAIKKWQKNNPKKYKAQYTLGNTVNSGKITKPRFCSICNKTKCKIEGHHEDYSIPLQVVWVCKPCHDILDEKRRQREKVNI